MTARCVIVAALITTWAGVGAAQPAGGMPDPRAMHGQPRPDSGMPVGTLSVRLTYRNIVEPDPPSGVPVLLVAYHIDGGVSHLVQPTGADGRAQFTGLDISGDTAYYALANLPRAGMVDRLASRPILPGGDQGIKLILSADARDAKTPPIDDAATLEASLPPARVAGHVRVSIYADGADAGGTLALLAVGDNPSRAAAPLPPGGIGETATGTFTEVLTDNAPPAGTFEVAVLGGLGTVREPVGGATVALISSAGNPVATSTTDARGVARFAVPKGPVTVTITRGSATLSSGPVTVSSASARLGAMFQWTMGPLRREVIMPITPGARGYYVEAEIGGAVFRSQPFLPAGDRGVGVGIYAVPRAPFSFELESFVDDEFLGSRGNMKVGNQSWLPYRASPDGVAIPAPRGAMGLQVAPQFEGVVNADRDGVFRIRRAIPPWGFDFFAGFSHKIERGEVVWRWPLPAGATGSLIAMREDTGARFVLPAGVRSGALQDGRGNRYISVQQITVPSGGQIDFTIAGLPVPPAWRIWIPRVAGLLGLLLLLGAAGLAIRAATRAQPSLDVEIENRLLQLAHAELAGATDTASARAALEDLMKKRRGQ